MSLKTFSEPKVKKPRAQSAKKTTAKKVVTVQASKKVVTDQAVLCGVSNDTLTESLNG